jgi:hypothetical protein
VAVPGIVDWGEPRPAEWAGESETLSARVPIDVGRAVRARARAEGVSVSVMVHRLLATAIHGGHAASRPVHADLVSTLFD